MRITCTTKSIRIPSRGKCGERFIEPEGFEVGGALTVATPQDGGGVLLTQFDLVRKDWIKVELSAYEVEKVLKVLGR